ncbi:hypothetical protein [Williamsia phyllosphaerae]|uniref:hypothetical protein n=1 Tax=Williamsia phyllosphaerae TaxID=885042 RepID=UPI00166DFB32|nr:hypothetical protein [Williamsia phyllosphaerae]
MSAGTMVRGALWLLQVVGVGNTFTKNELRNAFPNISQVDRRIRDLRDYGWVLYTNSEDASLLAEDQRFVKAGAPVWDTKARREAAPQKSVTNKERLAVLQRDSFMCTLCGISGGEEYPDDTLMTAVVAVTRIHTTHLDGSEAQELITECKRCRAGRNDSDSNVTKFIEKGLDLSPSDLRRLLRWAVRGRRGATEIDRVWSAYLRLPVALRQDAVNRLKEGTSASTRDGPASAT